jgi:hypothetical protein
MPGQSAQSFVFLLPMVQRTDGFRRGMAYQSIGCLELRGKMLYRMFRVETPGKWARDVKVMFRYPQSK